MDSVDKGGQTLGGRFGRLPFASARFRPVSPGLLSEECGMADGENDDDENDGFGVERLLGCGSGLH